MGLGHILVLHRGYISPFVSTDVFVLDGTHVSLNIRLGRHVRTMVTPMPTSPPSTASVRGGYFGSGIIMDRWGRSNKVKEIPRCNVKSPLHLWDIQDGCLTGVKRVGVDAIHGHAYLGVVVNSTVSLAIICWSL